MEQATATARVLVVEDDEAIADVLRRSLRAEGHEVRSAGDGAEALTPPSSSARTWSCSTSASPASTAWRSAAGCAPRATCRS